MIVVSDTSPVLNLARIGRLQLLALLYREVLIPSAVYDELAVSKSDLRPAIDLAALPWLVVATANDQKRVQELCKDLDRGEAEAIVLAIERRADLLLVDERRGRRTASAAGLRVTGLLGIVATAKRAGLIDLAKPVLDGLIPSCVNQRTRRIESASRTCHATAGRFRGRFPVDRRSARSVPGKALFHG